MLQIAGPPPYHPIYGRDRTALDQRGELRTLLLRQHWRRAWRRPIDQTVRTFFVEPMHPVAQGLAVHPADLGRVDARCAVDNRGYRQQPTRLARVPAPSRQSPQLPAAVIAPNYNRLTHGKPSTQGLPL